MSITVYGIKNCNTMKKTFEFLDSKGVGYDFVDYKKQKPTPELLYGFLKKTELASLVNKKGMTYRKMDEDQRADLEKEATAIPILIEHSSMIKRPVITFPNGEITLEFDPESIEKQL